MGCVQCTKACSRIPMDMMLSSCQCWHVLPSHPSRCPPQSLHACFHTCILIGCMPFHRFPPSFPHLQHASSPSLGFYTLPPLGLPRMPPFLRHDRWSPRASCLVFSNDSLLSPRFVWVYRGGTSRTVRGRGGERVRSGAKDGGSSPSTRRGSKSPASNRPVGDGRRREGGREGAKRVRKRIESRALRDSVRSTHAV